MGTPISTLLYRSKNDHSGNFATASCKRETPPLLGWNRSASRLERVVHAGPYLGFFVCGGKLGFREISDQYSYKKQPSKIRHYVRKKTFSFPGGGNCPLRPPAMYGPGMRIFHQFRIRHVGPISTPELLCAHDGVE